MKYLTNDLIIAEAPDPKPKGEEVLVQVHAAGVNRADLFQREGKYPPPKNASPILGLEAAGVVEGFGPDVKEFMMGDRVMCLLSGGGYSEKVIVPHSHCIPIPHNLSFEEAASIPETFLTAYQALFQIGEIQPWQWVLIHAGGSGVGTAAIQLAKQMDAKVIATSRSADKLEKCLAIGADAVINTAEGFTSDTVKDITEGHGIDLILDFIGQPYFEENIEALAMGGCIIFISTLGGAMIHSFDLRILMKKWATLAGTTLRNRSDVYKSHLVEEFSRFALSRFESGAIKPIVHSVLPWTEAKAAHAKLKDNQVFGKIVLSIYTPEA